MDQLPSFFFLFFASISMLPFSDSAGCGSGAGFFARFFGGLFSGVWRQGQPQAETQPK